MLRSVWPLIALLIGAAFVQAGPRQQSPASQSDDIARIVGYSYTRGTTSPAASLELPAPALPPS